MDINIRSNNVRKTKQIFYEWNSNVEHLDIPTPIPQKKKWCLVWKSESRKPPSCESVLPLFGPMKRVDLWACQKSGLCYTKAKTNCFSRTLATDEMPLKLKGYRGGGHRIKNSSPLFASINSSIFSFTVFYISFTLGKGRNVEIRNEIFCRFILKNF